MPDTQPTTQPATQDVGVIMEQLKNVVSDVGEIKSMLGKHIDCQQKFETETRESRAILNEKVLTIQDKVKEHDDTLKRHEGWQVTTDKVLSRLAMTDAVLRWVAAAFMLSLIALIWGILVHQVSVVIP